MDNAESPSTREEVAERIYPDREHLPASISPSDLLFLPRRNIILEKWQAAERDGYDGIEDNRKVAEAVEEEEARDRVKREYYFFYGSLMYPEMLRHVLGLSELPEVKPAEVLGYRTKLWGPYPALVDGEPGEPVKGMACEIEGGEHKDRLQDYETACYRTAKCMIRVEGLEEAVLGTTFMWNGDEDDLDDGSFDQKSWEARMGRILRR
ncbi:hypothetical protein VMCG_05738 [Cytospora schulzeri]|uniref:Putative gamma-glutamylcyclotransferase n=1 Tax=Cytospora schulzeri TaxID=448051 RepID=A0A423WI17_9PEZI|nr:hypothetical protein VMCG_05738 [Valsa malicola]